jgi:hypothetical protein
LQQHAGGQCVSVTWFGVPVLPIGLAAESCRPMLCSSTQVGTALRVSSLTWFGVLPYGPAAAHSQTRMLSILCTPDIANQIFIGIVVFTANLLCCCALPQVSVAVQVAQAT